jgi:hypothetical protein
MLHSVSMQPANTTVFLTDRPDYLPPGWELVEDVRLTVPEDLSLWPEGADRPQARLCVSIDDPKYFHVFKYEREIDRSKFKPTGLSYRGVYRYPSQSWELLLKFHEEALARIAVVRAEALASSASIPDRSDWHASRHRIRM